MREPERRITRLLNGQRNVAARLRWRSAAITLIDRDKSMRAKFRSWVAQLVIVAAMFTLLGFATAVAVFWNAPRVWSGSVVAGLAAGVGGILGWALLCGSRSRPAWWRTILAGMIAGVVLHPIYLLLESCLAGEPMALSDLITGSLFFLLVAGIITVPAGVAAAIACRGVSGWLSNQSSAEQNDARERPSSSNLN